MAITNKNIRGCIICQNKKISKIVDPILFNAEMSHKDIRTKLDEQHGIMVELSEVKAHARHIFDSDDDYKSKEKNELTRVNSVTTLDLVKEEIARVNLQIESSICEGKDGTLEFLKLEKTKIELLNIKAKLEGEINDNTIVVPEWLKRAEKD